MSSLDLATTDSLAGTSSTSSSRMLRSTNKESLHKTNRRVISKPKKRNGYCFDIQKNEKEIRNFYLNKRLGINKFQLIINMYLIKNIIIGKLKSTNLETIFEESSIISELQESTESSHVSFIGLKKVKRCSTLHDGINATKQIVQTRKKKIKRLMGSNLKYKKMSMENFLKRLHSMENESDSSPVSNDNKGSFSDSECIEKRKLNIADHLQCKEQ